MNCDDFLPALETGGPIRRLLARRHAAGCSRCAAVRVKFEALKGQLVDAPPLTGHAKALWERVAEREVRSRDTTIATPHWRRLLIPVAVGSLVAASIVLVFGPFHRARPIVPVVISPVVRQPSEGTEKSVIHSETVLAIDSTKEFNNLSAAVDQLDSEIERLRRKAEKAQARREVAVALDQFGRW